MGSIALTVLTLTLGLFFVFIGQFKVTSAFFPDVHEDMRREFGRFNKVFPFYSQTGWRPYAKNYRLAVGLIEVIAGAVLALIPGRLKQLANVVLLVIMLGGVYTHYVLHDKFERLAPGLIFSLLLITRLIIHRQVKQRERTVPKESKVAKKKKEEEEEEEEATAEEQENVGQESDDQASESENEEKQTTSNDKKKEKKNK